MNELRDDEARLAGRLASVDQIEVPEGDLDRLRRRVQRGRRRRAVVASCAVASVLAVGVATATNSVGPATDYGVSVSDATGSRPSASGPIDAASPTPEVVYVSNDHSVVHLGDQMAALPTNEGRGLHLFGSLAQTGDTDVLIVDTYTEEGDGALCSAKVVSWDVAQRRVEVVGDGFMPSTDPTGSKLAYVAVEREGDRCGQAALVVRDLTTGSEHSFAAPLKTERGSGQIQPQLAWSPDGRYLAFGRSNGDLIVLDTSSSADTVEEASTSFPPPAEGIQRPVWSPDGLLVVAISSQGSYLRPLDTRTGAFGEPLTDVPMDMVYDVSADGEKVLFAPVGSAIPSVLKKDGTVTEVRLGDDAGTAFQFRRSA